MSSIPTAQEIFVPVNIGMPEQRCKFCRCSAVACRKHFASRSAEDRQCQTQTLLTLWMCVGTSRTFVFRDGVMCGVVSQSFYLSETAKVLHGEEKCR